MANITPEAVLDYKAPTEGACAFSFMPICDPGARSETLIGRGGTNTKLFLARARGTHTNVPTTICPRGLNLFVLLQSVTRHSSVTRRGRFYVRTGRDHL